MSLLDFLFPKYCVSCKKFGDYLCPSCFAKVSFIDAGFCVACQKSAIGGLTHPACKKGSMIDGVFSSLIYRGVAKKLVYQFKYKPHVTDLQKTLLEFFYEGLIQKEMCYRLLQEGGVFIPIPLHKARFRKRGYNQAQLLAAGLSKKFDLPMLDCLERVKNTKTQVGLSKEDREENIHGAFALKKNVRLTDIKQVFLVDDVVTSGATLKEAAKILKKAGVKRVWGVTLAHGN